MSYMPDIRARATIRRDPHRSTTFVVQFDVSQLMDADGRPLVSGVDLESLLVDQTTLAIRRALNEGRAKVKGHP